MRRPAEAASARSSAAASSGSPAMARNFSISVRVSPGSVVAAPSAACSRKRSAISPTVRPPTVLMPAIESRSVTSACAAFGSERSRAARTPWYSGLFWAACERENVQVVGERGLSVEVLHQPALPGRRQIERRDQRREQPDVAHADFRLGDAVMRGGVEARAPAFRHRPRPCPAGRTTRCRPARSRPAARRGRGRPGRDSKIPETNQRLARRDSSHDTGMVRSGRRHSSRPSASAVRYMRLRMSSPDRSRNGSAGCRIGGATRR